MIQMKNPNAFDPRIIVSVQDATAADPQSSTSAISDPKNTSDAMPVIYLFLISYWSTKLN